MTIFPARRQFIPTLLILTWLAWSGQAATPTDPAILRASTWDQPVVIGPGGYRGTKILNKNKPKHIVQPGALIEKTDFRTDGSVRWEIEGALIRDCKFSGDLGTYLEAKNTAFEECNFHKAGGWFVAWHSTRWRFENCIFTRSFMPGRLGVGDYSVRAAGCTFVGIKIPVIGFRSENPARGVQGKDLQFVNCHFVGCEVPESALALTTDCTFENCQFPPKKDDWSKAEGPVKVTAHITAGRVPPSYVNDKLSITFVQGKPAQPTGAQLQHTLAGARILLPWAQEIRTFNELGAINKAATEIPVFNTTATAPRTGSSAAIPQAPPQATIVPAAPIAAVPQATPRPAAGVNSFFNLPEPARPLPPPTAAVPPPIASGSRPLPAPVAPASPTVRELRSFDELLVAIPLGQDLITAGRINPAALESANLALDQSSTGKPIALRVTVDELVAHRVDGFAFKVKSQPQPLSLRGQAVIGRVEALFRPDQAAGLSRVGKGTVLLVRGIVGKAELGGERRAVTFTVTVVDAKLQ